MAENHVGQSSSEVILMTIMDSESFLLPLDCARVLLVYWGFYYFKVQRVKQLFPSFRVFFFHVSGDSRGSKQGNYTTYIIVSVILGTVFFTVATLTGLFLYRQR